jgi:hypothetical protein
MVPQLWNFFKKSRPLAVITQLKISNKLFTMSKEES